jgi:hypothetical protein
MNRCTQTRPRTSAFLDHPHRVNDAYGDMALVLSRPDGTTQRWRISPHSEREARPEIGDLEGCTCVGVASCFRRTAGMREYAGDVAGQLRFRGALGRFPKPRRGQAAIGLAWVCVPE